MNMEMDQMIFPAKVFRGPDACNSLGEFCRSLGKRVFILGGKTALSKAEEKIQNSLRKADIKIVATEWYGGECSLSNINCLVEKVEVSKPNIIIAVGGGKAMDTGKSVAARCALPMIAIPTIAATCAAVVPKSIIYNDRGELIDVHFYNDCVAGIIIDTSIIIESPIRWLAAGMGDTLAKFYELRATTSRIPKTSLTISGISNGKLCYDLIVLFGNEARESLEKRSFSVALDSTIDSIILFAGFSSILGGPECAGAASHALYNGFTRISALHNYGHGLLVGYFNLCLLALEGRSDDEIIEAIKLAKECAIPITLAQIADLQEEELHTAIVASLESSDMANMPFKVTEKMVTNAISRVDQLSSFINNGVK